MEEVNRYCGGYQIITTKLFSPSLVLDFIAEAIEDQNLMQMHSSYVVTDPKGTILVECGKMLQRGRCV